ncbi:restriction endonuclease subunit S [Prescottella agglutinans]|uniref:restriction endonuclease subunit S n=1 Tax=Prescottella agglutinans TaxID=1644129 RepID=UPI003D965DCB
MTGWPAVELGQVTDILSGFAFDSKGFGDEGDLPVVRIRDVVRGSSETYYAGEFDPRFLIAPGEILIGMDGEFNRGRWRGGKALLNQRVCRISPSSSELDDGYLFHFLPAALKKIEDETPFVTVKHLSVKAIRAIRIPLPPLPEQRRIASILDHADALRSKRREALARLDELTQSIFIDMFGDPVANDREWPSCYVGDFVAGFDSGRNLVGAAEDVDAYRVLKVSAVTSLAYRESESKPLPTGYEPPVNHLVRSGDLLFSRANTAELVGATAFVSETDGRTALPDKLWRFRWHDDSPVAPRFVEKLFQRPEFRKTLSDRATGSSGSMKNISRMSVLSIAVGLPPLNLQRKFEKSVERVESVRSRHFVALDELDALFTSLQSRAFRGEL